MESDNPIPIDRWGKDHWSLLLYVEARIVDHRGRLNPDHMRPSPGQPPVLYGDRQRMLGVGNGGNYPTRLNDDTTVEGHSDWDCLRDLLAAKLLTVRRPRSVVPYMKGVGLSGLQELEVLRNGTYRLTRKGRDLANQCRDHRGRRKNMSSFVPQLAIS